MTDIRDKKERMKELVAVLDDAARSYYRDNEEIMSNFEYDRSYDELCALEEETGIVLAGSPTRRVGYEVMEELPKETHESPMLSLDKTKDPERLASWLGDKDGVLSWKLDGLTVALTYEDGTLQKAVTRGNGEVGEVITPNARTFINLPLDIPYKGKLTVRGEAVISYGDFKKINEEIPEMDAKYKNPRNLCSGSVRQLNSEVTASRRVRFMAFDLVDVLGDGEGNDDITTRSGRMGWLASLGFDTVYGEKVHAGNVVSAVHRFAEEVQKNDLPSDGLVLAYDDIEYGRSLGRTAKFPRDSIAFKWEDETAVTTIKDIEWSPSRTGLINPIALFEPVELEGTTVSRASVHNVSILRELGLDIGDKVKVYKANMIIPQIGENVSLTELKAGGSDIPKPVAKIPDSCPACGGDTSLKNDNGVETLYCTDLECPAKRIKAFELFAGRSGADIEGMSGMTIEKLAGAGIIKNYGDFFRLEDHRAEIVAMDGFGEKSFENMVRAAEKAREIEPSAFLCALGIPGIGKANARLIEAYLMEKVGSDKSTMEFFKEMTELSPEEIDSVYGLGPIIAEDYAEYFADRTKREAAEDAASQIRFKFPKRGDAMEGVTVVITGKLEKYSRDELKKKIEDMGGKVAGSVSKNTDWLLTNDPGSGSSKNKKAAELGVEIISEEDFLEKYGL